jgi:hypothetical protein
MVAITGPIADYESLAEVLAKGLSVSTKKNASAKDLWQQVFSRLAKEEGAALQDPTYDPSEDEGRMRIALRAAGWTDEHIDQRIAIDRDRVRTAPLTSPGVNPHVEVQLARLCDAVEAAMDRLKLDSHAKVARGVEPRAWASASNINVIMTEESVVTVSAFLFRFCGLIARAFMRTIQINPFGWEARTFNKKTAIDLLRRSPDLLRYWMDIYLSFALTGTHIFAPYKPATPSEIAFEDVAHAMELFVVAHEYGHHDLQHGKTLDADPHEEEFQADQFALKIGYEIWSFPFPFENPYLTSGAGGVIMLLALETLAATERILGRSRPASGTHPSVSSRLEKFDSVAVLQPGEFARLKNFRLASERVLRGVYAALIPALEEIAPILRAQATKFM